VKIARLLGDLFMFRESEKSLKRTPGGVPFSYNLVEPEKVIKVYSITFSCIYERKNDKKKRSRFYVKTIKNNKKHVITKKNMSVALY
jgi:hypothetical protein